VADAKTTDLPVQQRLAAEIMELLSSPTELGLAFAVDTRLRPDGEKGLLVNTTAAYEDYYRRRAMLWEIQCLTRARPVAGERTIGEQFQKLAATLTNLSQPSQPLAAYRPEWKKEIARMRARIEKERTPPEQNHLAIKTGTGGLVDAEFIAQTFCLTHGWQEPNTLRALLLARSHNVLSGAEADSLTENYRQLLRVEAILRRWSFAGEAVLPDAPAPLYRVAVRCGFPDAKTFMKAVGGWRSAIRVAYDKVMG
jgi:glutamate-ammonia-ligase adenylyltransferase